MLTGRDVVGGEAMLGCEDCSMGGISVALPVGSGADDSDSKPGTPPYWHFRELLETRCISRVPSFSRARTSDGIPTPVGLSPAFVHGTLNDAEYKAQSLYSFNLRFV